MGTRRDTRTYHAAGAQACAGPAPPRVQDPAVRDILRVVSRACKAISKIIDERCGTGEEEGDPP